MINDEEKELEKEVKKLITEAVDFRKSVRDDEYITNMAHYEGLQWNLAVNKDDSPFLLKSDINHLKNAVDLRLGSLFAESYYGELEPLSPQDVENINTLNVLYRNEWVRLNADDHVEAAVKNGCIQDNGYTEVTFDEGAIFGGTGTKREGSIVLKDLSTSDVYLDPKADSIDDCEYIVVKSKKSKNWLKRNKPDWLKTIKEKNIGTGYIGDQDEGDIYTGRNYSQVSSSLYSIDSVYRKYPEEIEVDALDDNGQPIIDEETIVYGDNGEMISYETVKEKIMTTRIKIHYMIGDILVETNEDYPFDEFNIIPFQWQSEPQSPYGIPLVRGLTTPQKVANLIESAENNIAMHGATPTWLVSEESGLDIKKVAKLGNAIGMVWKVQGNARDAIAQMPYPEVNEKMIGIRNAFVENIQMYSGVSQTYIGNIGTAGSTAEGTTQAVNRATVIDNAPIKQIEKYVEKLSRMIIKFMTRYYKNQPIYVRDTQKLTNGEYKFKDFLMGDGFENINYDFNVKLASRSKSDKNRQYNIMKDLYQTQNQYKDQTRVINVTDLVKAAQLDNYDEMFKRFQDMSAEAFNEKADMIMRLLTIFQVELPNGERLMTDEEVQQGLIDILDDNGDISLVAGIFKRYEEYQQAVANFNNNLAAQEQQQLVQNINNEQNQLQEQMNAGVQNMNQNADFEAALGQLGL